MQRSSKILITVVLTLGLAGAATAYGKHRFGNPEKRATHMVNYVSDELDLDSTQQQALTVFKDQLLSSRAVVRDEMTETREELKSLFAADVFDRAKALELINTRTSQINSMAPELVGSLGDFLDSLNADQKAQINEFIAEQKGRHHRFRH